jgi:L-malate glycosyltransferase
MLHHSHPAKGWAVGRQVLEAVHARVPGLRAVVFGAEAPDEPVPDWMTVVVDPSPEVLVEQVYNASQVFLQPSIYEGFGFTAVEAMACGCALVSTDNGGSDDYAHHDETALVAPPGDIGLLADHVETLLRDEGRRRRIAAAGADYVRRFRWDRAAEELELHLERYLADPAAVLDAPFDDARDEVRP